MNRQGTVPICAVCMKPHRRLTSEARAARRAELMRVLRYLGLGDDDPAFDYAMTTFDHLTLDPKYKPGVYLNHEPPLTPYDWSAQKLEMVDRAVLHAVHLAKVD